MTPTGRAFHFGMRCEAHRLMGPQGFGARGCRLGALASRSGLQTLGNAGRVMHDRMFDAKSPEDTCT